MSDAVFTEVLEISVDVAAFTDGLAALESAYDDFVQRLSEKGVGAGTVFDVGAFSALEGSISELSTQMQGFQATVDAAMQTLDAGLQRAQAGVQKTGQAAVDAAANVAKGQEASGGGLQLPGGMRMFMGNAKTFMDGMNSSINGLNGGLLGMLGYMAALRASWEAVGIVIDAVVAAIKSPFEFIKTGIEYLEQLQTAAAQLQGPIAANVKFTEDIGNNFKIAGDKAQQVRIQLQDMAVQMGVPVADLQKEFIDLVENGSSHYVHDLQGSVDLTRLMNLAVMATTKDVRGQMEALKEIPLLLSGQETGHENILRTLHLNKAEWEAIRQEALQHGDLVEQLSSRLQPYLSVLDEAHNRQANLVAGIELLGQKIAGAVALNLWQALIGMLQEVDGFLTNHELALEAMARSVLGIVTGVGQLLSAGLNLVNVFLPLKVIAQGFYAALVDGTFAVRSIIAVLTAGVNQLATLLSTALDPKKVFSTTAWKQTFSDMEAAGVDAFHKIQDAAVDANESMVGGKAAADKITGGVPNAPLPTDDKAAAAKAKADFQAMQQDYRDQLELTRKKFSETESDIKDKVQTGAISFHEATQQRITAIHNELAAVQALVLKYTELSSKSSVPKPEIQKFQKSLETTADTAQIDANKQIATASAGDVQQTEDIQRAHYARLRAMALQHSKDMLDLYKQEERASDGISGNILRTRVDVFDKEQDIARQEHYTIIANLQAELQAAGDNEKEKSRIMDEIAAADQKYTDATAANSTIRSRLATQDAIDAAAQAEKIIKSKLDLLKAQDKLNTGSSESQFIADEKQYLNELKQLADQEVAAATRALAAAVGTNNQAAAQERLNKAKLEQLNIEKQLQDAEAQTVGGRTSKLVFGNNTQGQPFTEDQVKDVLQHPFDDFGQSVTALGNSMKFFGSTVSNFVNAIKSGYQQGGVMGAIGGGLGQVGGLLSQAGLGPAGAIVSGIGSIFSLFGDLFTAHAKKIAQDIQKAVGDLMNQYANGQTTLVATITSLEAQRTAAIQELSNQKGGQDQLNQLLPQLDNQIAQLKLQQKNILDQFNQNLDVLRLQSSTLGNMLSTWQQINKQVTDYLNAGGSAANAAETLSLTLKNQLVTAQNSLNDGENQALQDAMQLNDLLTQRVALVAQIQQQEFALQNQGALERMADPAINAAIAANLQREQNQQQLTALNQQIDLYTSRVTMEKQVYNLASDTASLQAESNRLNLIALQQTIQGWQDLKKIISSITQTSSGLYSFNPSMLAPDLTNQNQPTKTPASTAGPITTVTVGNITVNAGSANPTEVAAALKAELSLLGQQGANVSYA